MPAQPNTSPCVRAAPPTGTALAASHRMPMASPSRVMTSGDRDSTRSVASRARRSPSINPKDKGMLSGEVPRPRHHSSDDSTSRASAAMDLSCGMDTSPISTTGAVRAARNRPLSSPYPRAHRARQPQPHTARSSGAQR